MSGDFQDEIKCLGIEASPSFVREPEGNGVAERFIRTLKENLLWVRTFKTIEELRAELLAFARRYNETWLVARHGYKTPARVREEQTMPRIAIDPTLAATLPLAARAGAAGCLKTVPHYILKSDSCQNGTATLSHCGGGTFRHRLWLH
jgi:putative transposase